MVVAATRYMVVWSGVCYNTGWILFSFTNIIRHKLCLCLCTPIQYVVSIYVMFMIHTLPLVILCPSHTVGWAMIPLQRQII